MFLRNVRVSALAALALMLGATWSASAQGTATIRGVVTRSGDAMPLGSVQITVVGTGLATVTNPSGRYLLQRVPAGEQTLLFRWLGYAPVQRVVNVTGDMTVDAALEPQPVMLADLMVSVASREPERIVEAPAAVTLVEPRVLQNTAATGQAPLALAQAPGVDLVQSGVNDFNINARGFNSSLNRRVLTLLDGRDLAIAFLGSQEWNTLPVALDELRSMELVRGPGSALYGANAFAGVINMTTLSPREVQGAKLTVSGGELSSMKIDGRWASVFGEGRWGVRVNGGYSTNDTWSRSRTSGDKLDLRREYAEALGKDSLTTPAMSNPEAIPINGQALGALAPPIPREATGDRDPITAMYGMARVDRYLDNGGVFTLEGGASQTENEILVTGIGRVQVIKGFKPFVRAAYNSERFNVFGYWNNRESKDPQFALASGASLIEKSNIYHGEAQANQMFMDGRAKVIVGASIRQYNVNTEGTLMLPENDNRGDKVYSAYGQVEFRVTDQIRLVGAARYDEGDLFEGQFSPKGGIVFSPNENHSFRVTVNRAFQTPNYSEFFLRVAAGAPVNFSALEAGMRASALGPALAGVPDGTLFTNSAAVPVFARGNAGLEVEETIGYEIGWKGSLGSRVYVSVDAYMNNIKNFVTDLLPGVNTTQFPYWTAPAAVPESVRPQLIGAIQQQLGASPATALAGLGLSRTEDGNTAIVVSYANAGEVDQTGVDVGLGYQLTDEFRVDGTLSYFDFEVKSQATGDQLVPNTPEKKATLTLSYEGLRNGIDASVSVRAVQGYDWAAGVFVGHVPSSEFVNASLGWQANSRFRVFAIGTNILDQQRFQLYGGAVIGRRILGGITANF